MFYTIDKIRNRINELDGFRYREAFDIKEFDTKLNDDKDIT